MDAKGVVISYATGLGEIANDEITYTSQLIKAIQAHANQPIEVVLSEAQELTAQATGDRQTPWYEKGMVGKFCFGTCGKQENTAELERLRRENELLKQQQANVQPSIVTPPIQLGKSFRDRLKDGSLGPEMVQIPGGTFQMGDKQGFSEEKQVHTVTVKSFAMGKYEVTFEEYDKFCEATRREKPSDSGWGRGKRPVINVSWNDAKVYVKWLSEQTGKDYHLPSEAQWEYACRAGTTTKYWWGNQTKQNHANCYDCGSLWDNKQTAPVGSFKPNPYGLYDVYGNVLEWNEDTYYDNYNSAPNDGSARVDENNGSRVYRGGAWNELNNQSISCYIRGAATISDEIIYIGKDRFINSEARTNHRGFRVSRM
jgi:formylglycine-generating enzyme required for sulfatase activity